MQQVIQYLKVLVFAAFFALLIHYFMAQPYSVDADTMIPRYNKGDILLVERLQYFLGSFKRNDVIVFRDTKDPSKKHIGRIIGLPNEEISVNDGILTIAGNEKIIQELPLYGMITDSLAKIGRLDAHEYFVMDNKGLQGNSGIVDERLIIGKPFLTLYPINKISIY